MSGFNFIRRCMASAAVAVLLSAGCATQPPAPASAPAPPQQPFSFKRDTFAYSNEMRWNYGPGGAHTPNQDQPRDYTHHCFAMSSGVRQFRVHARFEPRLSRLAGEEGYRQLVREVYGRSRRQMQPDTDPVVIPGYAGLREFSTDWGQLLRDESGSSARSYFERGNWRMVFPFSRSHQQHTLDALLARLARGELPVVHLVRFPVITINHAVLVYAATQTPAEVRISIYDPNHSEMPATLIYTRATRSFELPANDYFEGGRVDVYEIFKGIAF